MNQLNILVIDDEVYHGLAPRELGYLQLKKHKISNRDVAVEFAQDVSDAKAKLTAGNVSIALIDVVLQNFGDRPDARPGLNAVVRLAISGKIPIAFISQHWDQNGITIVRTVMRETGVSAAPLFLSTADLEPDRVVATAEQINLFLTNSRTSELPVLEPDQPLWLLHISDLHFGSADTEKTLAGDVDQQLLVQAILRQTNGAPIIVAITGDVAHTGHPNEYASAFTWLSNLLKELSISLPSRRVLMVPGNHDYSLPLSAATRIKLENGLPALLPATPNDPALAKFAQRPFIDFFERICRIDGALPGDSITAWISTSFLEHGLVFTGLNSSATQNVTCWPFRALTDEQLGGSLRRLSTLRADSEKRGETSAIHVLLCHHSPVKYDVDQEIVNHADFAKTFNAQPDGVCPNLILHGHEHSRVISPQNNNKSLIVSAATPSQREENRSRDTARGFSMLRLNRVADAIKGVTFFAMAYRAKDGNVPEGWALSDSTPTYSLATANGNKRVWQPA